MKLNHLNLVVTNVAEAVSFFEKYFGFTCTDIKGDSIIAVLKGIDDFLLVLIAAKDAVVYPDAFHIGFMQETVEQVGMLYAKLKEGNMSVGKEPAKIRDTYGFYFYFDNILIEVGAEV